MKQAAHIFVLFLAFVGFFTCIEMIDRYSAEYHNCSQQWRAEIERSKAFPALAGHVKTKLEKDDMVASDNRACPGLWPSHKAALIEELSSKG